MRRDVFGQYTASVTDTAAAEHLSVTIENLAIPAVARQTNLIQLARHRSEVAAEHQEIVAILRVPCEADHAGFGIAKIDPLKPAKLIVHLVQCRFLAIQTVQRAHHRLKLVVDRKLKQPPRQAL